MVIASLPFGAMASDCLVCVGAPSKADAERWAGAAVAEVRRIEAKYSRYRSDTIVSRINAAAGGSAVALDPETEALLGYADAVYASSAGLFDISSGVLRRAWDFKRGQRPAAGVLDALLPLIGWNQVERTAGSLRLPRAGMELDFGGFGKEYAADRAAAILESMGARCGYVNLGGDLRAIGPLPDGAPWQIGIQDPRQPDALIASIPLAKGALATSGDYERFFELDGRRYCHILNPRTGEPVNYFRSVSVLAPLAIAAGSVATVAMLKQEDGLAFLDESGLAYLAVDRAGRIHSRDINAAPRG